MRPRNVLCCLLLCLIPAAVLPAAGVDEPVDDAALREAAIRRMTTWVEQGAGVGAKALADQLGRAHTCLLYTSDAADE